MLCIYGNTQAQELPGEGLIAHPETSLLRHFNHPTVFTAKDGFPLTLTSAIIKDDRGFVWIGGHGGLVRFDGSVFTEIPLCVEGTEHWWVRDLWLDTDRQRLWIATWGYGLLQMDLATYACSTVYTGDTHTDRYVYWIHPASDTLWIGKTKGLTAVPLNGDNAQHYSYIPDPAEQEQLNIERVNNMIAHRKDMLNDSILWIGSVSGLLRFNLISHQFARYYNTLEPNNAVANSIREILQEADGRLLLGTWGAGVSRFDPTDGSFSQSLTTDNGQRHRVISQLHLVSRNRAWITTTDGIYILDLENWTVEERLDNELEKSRVYGCKYIDEAGRIYFGRGNMLVIYDPLLQQFPNYGIPLPLLGTSTSQVKGIIGPDADQRLWLMLYGGKGIYRYDITTGEWVIISLPGTGNTFPANYKELRDGNHLFLAKGAYGYVFHPDTRLLDSIEIWPDPTLTATNFLEHSDGSIWFSTQAHGLIRRAGGVQQQYRNELQHPAVPEHFLTLAHTVEDSLGNVWINSITGYSVYDYRRDTFFNFPFLLPDTTELADISRIVKDSTGGIWLISFRHGLMRVDPECPECGVTATIQDFRLKNIQTEAMDRKGRLWLFGDIGFEVLHPQTLSSQVIDRSYGLPERIDHLSVGKDGRFYLGQKGTFQVFHPDSLLQNQALPLPYIAGFTVFDRPLRTDVPLHRLREIALAPQQNFFSIQFSSIDFTLAGQDSFAYQLEGVDPDWVYTRNRREVFYTNLPSGNYTFKLRAANNEGIWNPEMLSVAIRIATPWWKTLWALLTYLLFGLGLLYALYRFQLSRRLALAESERLRELNAWKGNFYTNVTHEFRTPLTVILGMTNTIEQATRTANNQKILHANELIKRNGERLLKLVNDILDLAKLEQGKLEVQLKQIDVIPLVKYLAESYQSLAHAKHIEFAVSAEPDSLMMDTDTEKLTIILSNLIINAIKFTPENGAIAIHFGAGKKGDRSFLTIEVNDTGRGLSAVEQEAVFERFYQAGPAGESASGGTGIGLALTRELVQLLGGQIGVDTRPGRGSTFWVQLPITRQAPVHRPEAVPARSPLPTTPVGVTATSVGESAADRNVVLIIEDSNDVAQYLQDCLVDQYLVRYAPTGEMGVDLAIEHIPDLIISDVMMPGMDGFAVCEQLKTDERTNHIPIILLTARATATDKVKGIRRGADAYITKPFIREELLARLDQLLALRTTLQQKYSGALTGHRPKDPVSEDLIDAFVAKAEQIILLHLDDDSFSGDDLARALLLSPSQAYRKIKALTGMSTALYVRHVRLQQAKLLLDDHTLTVSEVAYRSGFRSPAYFSQAFKGAFGESPSAFRKKES